MAPVILSVCATGFMSAGIVAAQTMFSPHVTVMIILGAVLYLAAYVVSLAVWNRISAVSA
jgi:hypothetical protein